MTAPSLHSAEAKKNLRAIFPKLRVTKTMVEAMFKTQKTYKACLDMVKKAKELIRWAWIGFGLDWL